ncbi:hypothetical protein [Nocardioides sp.]|uniref:hypothetical protein n=1 Tax=Nocardioides sp. TaxID=35761 RepID=UPI0037842ACA
MVDTVAEARPAPAGPGVLALSVHGAAGVLDLVVPAGASAGDVADEYARRTGAAVVPELWTRAGVPIDAEAPLERAGVTPGALLVATTGAPAPAGRRTPAAESRAAGPEPAPGAAVLGFGAVGLAALLAGWCAATAEGPARGAALALLVLGAVLAVLPVGRFAAGRLVVAPAFGAAVALALAWDAHAERIPLVLGAAGLAAAVVAGVGRALEERCEEALRVWVLAGAGLFALTGLATLVGAPPRATWAVLLTGAVLAARFVPAMAIDVPDQYLLDLERLAVTAWSARSRPPGKRGRSVVPVDGVGAVAARGTRLVVAASAAVLVLTAVAAPMLLATATLPIDRTGARCLTFFAGAALLLTGRSHRHLPARLLLRAAGLVCWLALSVAVLGSVGDRGTRWLVVLALGLGAVLVVVGVAAGRGWRSAWWSRRAEVAEGLCGALAVASLVVAAGWFRELWELASLWELGS